MTEISELTKSDLFLLGWLAKAEYSQYGECYGTSLDALVARGLAQVHEKGDKMYNKVSVTDSGLAFLHEKAEAQP